jgi:uncharacterized protein
VIDALMNVYTISAKTEYLLRAKDMADLVLKQFGNPDSDLLYYTDADSSELISRSTETSDNVIPASNSQMALNFFYLGRHFSEEIYTEKAQAMLKKVPEELRHYASGYSNWGCLALHLLYPFYEIAIVGNNVDEKVRELHQHSHTNAILAVSAGSHTLPLLANRFVAGKTLVYVCKNNTCKRPVENVEEALEQF